MRNFKLVLLIFFSGLVLAIGWLYIAWMSLEQTALSSDFYRGLIRETNIAYVAHPELQNYLSAMLLNRMPDRIGGALLEEFDNDLEENAEEEEVDEETRQIWTNLIHSAVIQSYNSAWIENQVFAIVDENLPYIKGEQDSISGEIDLREIKASIHRRLIHELETLPGESLLALNIPIKTTDLHVGADTIQDFYVQIEPGIVEILADEILAQMDLPDEISLDTFVAEADLPPQTDQAISAMNQVWELFQYWPYILLSLLFLITLLLAEPSAGLKWFGISTLIFSLTALLCLQVILYTITTLLLLMNNVVIAGASISPALVADIAEYTISRTMNVPLTGLVVGLVMLVGGMVIGLVSQVILKNKQF